MVSTATTILGLEKQGTGDNSNSWGTVLNAQLDLIEEAVSGTTTISLASGDVTLTTTDYASNQARPSHLLLTGALGASQSVIVPAKSKLYCVTNSTTQTTDYTYTATVKTSAGTGVTVAAGGRPVWIRCDGTNVVEVSGLPYCAISEETEVSLASTNNKTILAFASGAIEADPYSMANAGTNVITVPTGAELVQISCNAFFTGTIATSTTVSLGITQQSGSPGSSGGYPYEAVAQVMGSGSSYTPATVSAMFHLPNNLNQARGLAFSCYGQLNVATAGIAVSAFETNVVVLR